MGRYYILNIKEELKDEKEAQLVALLSTAYTLLALAPYDDWGHEGSPGQMAAYVIKVAKERGNLGFLYSMFKI